MPMAPIPVPDAKVPDLEPATPTPTPPTPEPQTKEFELSSIKYKLVIGKDGRKMHYKDGRMTSEADYSKAASML